MTKIKDLYGLPVVPDPRLDPTKREINRPMAKELKKHNSKFLRIQEIFLEELNDERNDKSYKDCFNDLMEAWGYVASKMTFNYTRLNENYTRQFQPIEQ